MFAIGNNAATTITGTGGKYEYMESLNQILPENDSSVYFPCIKDLIEKGADLQGLFTESRVPNRQEVTQHLLTWFKYIGVSAETCQAWMIHYAVTELGKMSSRSASAIRHSTKSNIKYIYRNDNLPECNFKKDLSKTICSHTCPIYEYRPKKKIASGAPEKQLQTEAKKPKTVVLPSLLKRDIYAEQFEEAIQLAEKLVRQGVAKKEICQQLQLRGFKTRTGKEWAYSGVIMELKKRQQKSR